MRLFGTILFAVGLILFMDILGWFDAIAWDIVWPIILMVVGIWIVLRSRPKNCECGPLCKVGGTCGVACDSCHGNGKEEAPAKANGSKK